MISSLLQRQSKILDKFPVRVSAGTFCPLTSNRNKLLHKQNINEIVGSFSKLYSCVTDNLII